MRSLFYIFTLMLVSMGVLAGTAPSNPSKLGCICLNEVSEYFSDTPNVITKKQHHPQIVSDESHCKKLNSANSATSKVGERTKVTKTEKTCFPRVSHESHPRNFKGASK